MTVIKSNLTTAGTLTSGIQTAAGVAPTDVTPAANVTVTVNQQCLDAHSSGKAIFERYQAAAHKDASLITNHAGVVETEDKKTAKSLSGQTPASG